MMLAQEIDEALLAPDIDAELRRLVELRAGRLSGDDEGGLLRHAACDLGAERFELFLRLIACERRQGAGQHDGLSVQRARRSRLRTFGCVPKLLDGFRRTLRERP